MFRRHRFQVFSLVGVIAACLTLAATASAAGKDPRVCALNNRLECAQSNTVAQLKKAMNARMHVKGWDADIVCKQASPSLLVWRCSWKGGSNTGQGVLRWNPKTFVPKLTVVSNVCAQPASGNVTFYGCTKIVAPSP